MGYYHKDLFPYQKEGALWLSTLRNAILGDQMRVGKTPTAIAGADLIKARNILVVCPGIARPNWEREFQRWQMLLRDTCTIMSGKDRPTAEVCIVSYELLSNRPILVAIIERQWDLLIVDECFPADTLVETDRGPVRIADIFDGDELPRVLTRDPVSGGLRTQRVLRAIRHKRKSRLVKVTHEFGHFICTESHKVYTDEGLKQASQLGGSNLFRLQSGFPYAPEGQSHSSVLHPGMRPEPPFCNDGAGVRAKTASNRDAGMPVVRIDIFGDSCSSYKVLFDKMLGQVAGYSEASEPGVLQNGCSQNGCDEDCDRVSALFGGQSTPIGGPEAEVRPTGRNEEAPRAVGSPERENLPRSARGERQHYTATEEGTRIAWATDGVSYSDGTGEVTVREPSALLLCGPGGPTPETGGGDRRPQPQNEKMAFLGCEERKSIVLSRVDRVEVLERGSGPGFDSGCEQDQWVYDLEVDGDHNYFADGCLVSNCHLVKNKDALRTQILYGAACDGTKGVASHCKRVWLLTGTPIPNGLHEMWPHARALFPKAVKGLENYNAWLDHFCYSVEGDFGTKVLDARHVDDFVERFHPYIKRRLLKDVQPDLPPIRFSNVVVQPTTIPVRMQHVDEQETVIRAALAKARGGAGANPDADAEIAALAAIDTMHLSTLHKWTGIAKAPAVAEYIAAEMQQGLKKVVIFAKHSEVFEILKKTLPGQGAVINGQTPTKNRQPIIDAFMGRVPNQNLDWIAVHIDIASTAIDLTAAQDVIFAETSWVPKDVLQAAMRCMGINQSKAVLARIMSLKGSLDEAINDTIVRKHRMISKIETRFATS